MLFTWPLASRSDQTGTTRCAAPCASKERSFFSLPSKFLHASPSPPSGHTSSTLAKERVFASIMIQSAVPFTKSVPASSSSCDSRRNPRRVGVSVQVRAVTSAWGAGAATISYLLRTTTHSRPWRSSNSRVPKPFSCTSQPATSWNKSRMAAGCIWSLQSKSWVRSLYVCSYAMWVRLAFLRGFATIRPLAKPDNQRGRGRS